MKLGLGLYRHLLTRENFQFARQAGATHIVAHLVDYFKGGAHNPGDNQPTGTAQGWGLRRRPGKNMERGGVARFAHGRRSRRIET